MPSPKKRPSWIVPLGIIVAIAAIGTVLLHWRTGSHIVPTTTLVNNAPYDVHVSLPEAMRIGEPATIRFTVQKDGQAVDSEADGRALHVVLSSPSYEDFLHVYPADYQGKGEYIVTHTFTQPGPHRVWTELVNTHNAHEQHHGQFADVVAYAEFSVSGDTPLPSQHQFVRGQMAEVDTYKVQLAHPPLVAGQSTTIQTTVHTATGQAVPLLEYEPSIYVMLGSGLEFFRHGHTNPPKNGTIIEITDTFPTAGEYLYWTQIPVPAGDTYELLEVPFLLNVAAS